MQKPINLDHVARLAEHLDAIGERQLAIIVRADLAALRAGQVVPYERLLHVAAELVHDGDTQLDNVRQQIADHISARECHEAAEKGGGHVAELVDAAIVMAVRLMAPYRNACRAWPAIGEKVIPVDLLAEVAGMDSAAIAAKTGIVRGGVRSSGAAVQTLVLVAWPDGDIQWEDVTELAALQLWRNR